EKILPPIYEKKPGRPPKSRRKQPHEVQGKNGPKLSKHGVVIHCKHCSEANHNAAGCKLKKMGFSSEDAKALVANTQATLQEEARQATTRATATEEHSSDHVPLNQQMGLGADTTLVSDNSSPFETTIPTMVSRMLTQESQSSCLSQPVGHLPDSSFIISNELLQRPVPLTTATKAGQKATAKKRGTQPSTTTKGSKKSKAGPNVTN
ncbi:hypothetical protein BS78_01G173800, partial [Paspalum vaginatum]